jgi:hypothetical protein
LRTSCVFLASFLSLARVFVPENRFGTGSLYCPETTAWRALRWFVRDRTVSIAALRHCHIKRRSIRAVIALL